MQRNFGPNIIGPNGKVVSQTTRQRWEKEFGRTMVSEPTRRPDGEPNPQNAHSPRREEEQLDTESSTSFQATPAENSTASYEDSPAQMLDLRRPVIPQHDSWPWATVDIPGSPQLSRLFEALSIHFPSTIEPLDLSEPAAAPSVKIAESRAHSQFVNLSSIENGPVDGRESDSQALATRARKIQDDTDDRLRRHFNRDVFFPSGNWLPPSPFNEVYPFPITVHFQTHESLSSNLLDLSQSALAARANRLQTSLTTFGGTLPETSPVILQTMEDIADIYLKLGDHIQSETWWKRLIDLRAKYEDSPSRHTTSVMMKLWRTMCFMHITRDTSKFEEFMTLEKKIQSYLSTMLTEDDDLSLDFLKLKSMRLANLGRIYEAEDINRQILQIRLTHMGPRSPIVLRVMSSLGRTIITNTPKDVDRSNKGLFLCRTAVQLHKENEDLLEGFGQDLLNDLLYTLRYKQQYEEAAKFAKLVVKRCRVILGERHTFTLRYMAELGASLRRHENYTESVGVFKEVLKLSTLKNTSAGDLMWRMEELAMALRGLQNYHQAAIYLNKILWDQISSYGALHPDMKVNCWFLGDSHIQAGELQRAVDVYTRYLELVRIAATENGEVDHAFIPEIQGWINDTKRLILVNDESHRDYSYEIL
ncbi:hypothetical protein B0O99DRAFT_629668 [Bisporella sp. PMI_857]|nr:hypothetical protein B0O99DRAFT_629668 [Bisporella sp. PMI_857]